MADDVVLYSAGAIPGVPGEVAPGVYTIDTDARTATFVAPLPDTQDPTQVPTPADAPVVPTNASAPAPTDAPVAPSTSTATPSSSN